MVTELSKMLVQGQIDENSTVYIDAAPNSSQLQFRVEKDGGVASAASKNKENLVKGQLGSPAKAVKKMRFEDAMGDLMEEDV